MANVTFENNFLEEDKEKALNELACIGDCLQLSMVYMLRGDFKRATLHIENTVRSLGALDQLKNNKCQWEESVDELLHELSDLGVDINYIKVG